MQQIAKPFTEGAGGMSNEIFSRLLYPDPFRPTGIEVDMHAAGRITLRILHEDGSEPNTLIENEYYEKGKHVLPIERAEMACAGALYQLLVEIDGKTTVETKRI